MSSFAWCFHVPPPLWEADPEPPGNPFRHCGRRLGPALPRAQETCDRLGEEKTRSCCSETWCRLKIPRLLRLRESSSLLRAVRGHTPLGRGVRLGCPSCSPRGVPCTLWWLCSWPGARGHAGTRLLLPSLAWHLSEQLWVMLGVWGHRGLAR